jgi:DNA topoisomerase IB
MPPVPRGLVYVSDDARGIRRVRLHVRQKRGRKNMPARFHYVAASGRRIKDPRTLARIASLAIPPAYEDVWICSNPRGHLQATGRDARGRKQYRYHPDWSRARNVRKHSRMLEFGKALAPLRASIRRDLKLPGLPREKVLALVVKLLDTTQVRVGNAEYARTNGSFGLTTLRDRHVRFPSRGKALLHFRGKGGADHDVMVDDARLAKLVRRCQELPGQALFQYVDDNGGRHAIDSGQVNEYLRERMGSEFTAKDFRTWHATLNALTLARQDGRARGGRGARGQTLSSEGRRGCCSGASQHAGGVPQVVHQSRSLRRMAHGRPAPMHCRPATRPGASQTTASRRPVSQARPLSFRRARAARCRSWRIP